VCRGGSIKTHKETNGEEHPVSYQIFLVNNVIIMKVMDCEIQYRRVAIFIISKRRQEIMAIKIAEDAEINQSHAVCRKQNKYVTNCIWG
jgi:ribosomal protein L32E